MSKKDMNQAAEPQATAAEETNAANAAAANEAAEGCDAANAAADRGVAYPW